METIQAENLTPFEFRLLCREQKHTGPTTNYCDNYVQANLVIMPQKYAEDFQNFCELNPKPCPLLEMTESGEVHANKFCQSGLDIRSDLPRYKVYRNGEFIEERLDIKDLWQNDFVCFLIGCSFSFESALQQAGLSIRHIEEHKNVPMYKTNIPCKPAGIFHGNMVVSMRPFKPDQAQLAYEVTSNFPRVHGAPVYSGNDYFNALGISDISKPDYGDSITIHEDEVPVFWACGVTPQNVITQAKEIPILITHAPGHMLITDILNDELKSQ
eukprot:403358247